MAKRLLLGRKKIRSWIEKSGTVNSRTAYIWENRLTRHCVRAWMSKQHISIKLSHRITFRLYRFILDHRIDFSAIVMQTGQEKKPSAFSLFATQIWFIYVLFMGCRLDFFCCWIVFSHRLHCMQTNVKIFILFTSPEWSFINKPHSVYSKNRASCWETNQIHFHRV